MSTYDEVRTTLNGYFDVRRSLIVQRALFNPLVPKGSPFDE